MRVPDDAGKAVDDISFASPDDIDENPHDPQACLKDGIDLIFSDATLPSEQGAPLLTIDDVRGDVGLHVLSHIASLKNVDSIQRWQRMMGDPKTSMSTRWAQHYLLVLFSPTRQRVSLPAAAEMMSGWIDYIHPTMV